MRLTDRNVMTLPLKREPYATWDHGTDSAGGLYVVTHPSGIRTYRALYHPGRASKTMKLGRVGEITLDEARQLCRDVRGRANKGLHPTVGESGTADTFEAILNLWIKIEQIGRKATKSAEEVRQFVTSSCRPWLSRPVHTISYQDIEGLLATKRETAPEAANRLHAHMRTMFRWAKRSQRLQSDPMYDMPKPFGGTKPRNREWFKGEKADDLIRKLWLFADELDGPKGRLVKLLILTGKRRTCVEDMRWEAIDKAWLWTPPPGSDSKKNFPVTLPRLARTVLGKQQASGRVFEHCSPNMDGLVKTARKAIKQDDFLWHGLRHIVETKLAELRVPPHVRDCCLDHVAKRGAGAGYDHHDYREEVAQAFERWAAHVAKLAK